MPNSPHTPSLDADRRAIEALNEQDQRAALAGDVDTIASQWSEEFTVLPAAGPIIRGRAANVAIAEGARAQLAAIEPVEYVAQFEEITICGDYAFEWGIYRGSMRPPGGDLVSYSGKVMRILQRQPDGSWKMHRTMTTTDPASAV